MIVNYTVENFRSIKTAQTINFVPDATKHLRDNLLSTDERPDVELLPSVFVYGGNGAGKSNLCRSIEVFRSLAVESAGILSLDQIVSDLQPFRLDCRTAQLPTRFSAEFLLGQDFWEYVIVADKDRIHEESLRRKANTPKGRWAVVFARSGNDRTKWIGNAARINHGFFQSVRDHSTILSKALFDNIAAVEEVYRAILPISVRSMASAPRFLVREVDEFVRDYEPIRSWLSRITSCADVAFDSINLVNEEVAIGDFPNRLKGLTPPQKDVRALVRDLRFVRRRDDGESVAFELEDVSGGTVRFLALVLEIFTAARLGSILVLDEFDASLHPLLAREVRNLLLDPFLSSPAGSQYVLVTHNDSLLDPLRMRRDQILLLNQTPEGATGWYSMSDLDRVPKPDESFQKRYLNGGYGGVPRVGDLRSVFLDMVSEWKRHGS